MSAAPTTTNTDPSGAASAGAGAGDGLTLFPPRRGRAFGFNPLLVKGFRGRVRRRHLLTWGVVTLTLAAFISLIIYTVLTQQRQVPAETAARAVLPGLVVLQAVIMMMSGTGAVAAGIARERDGGLLDYHRMTPMRPASAIFGSLFGLAAREYALFAITMPLVIIAAVIGNISPLTLLHFYVVFFTSVLVYHMTALVAGTVTKRPRAAQMMSVGLVVLLYFVLPNLSRVGLTFFEFLTIRPTFMGLVMNELPEEIRVGVEARGLDSFQPVPLFESTLHPTAYSLVVQVFVFAAMFSIVHRRWRNPVAHLFSKGGAFVIFGGISTFLLASVWAIVRQDQAYNDIFGPLNAMTLDAGEQVDRIPQTLEALLILMTFLLGGAWVLLVAAITPSRQRMVEAWRWAAKNDRLTLAPNSDGASSRIAALAMLVVFLASLTSVMILAARGGQYFASGPSFVATIAFVLGVVGTALYVQGLRERFGLRGFSMMLFLGWAIPFFGMMIILAAFDYASGALAMGMPFPAVHQSLSIASLLESCEPFAGQTRRFMPDEVAPDAVEFTWAGALGTMAFGVWMQTLAARERSRRRLAGLDAA
ncbi:MAG: hypothetical protein AB8G96_11280 [Phycisphaerales bacterium]